MSSGQGSADIRREMLRLPEAAAATPGIEHFGRFCCATFLLGVGEQQFRIHADNGVIKQVDVGPFLMAPWRFAISATEQSWRKFWLDCPPPGYNDIFAMSSYGHARIEGDVAILLKDLRFFKTIVALPRGRINQSSVDQ